MDVNKLAALFLMEDEEEEDLIQLLNIKRAKTCSIYQTRQDEGYFQILIRSHLKADEKKFREFFRLNQNQFDFVLSLIKEDIVKPFTHFVKCPISPEEKLAVTLRFLATGETFRSLSFSFRISHSYISIIIQETLKALCQRLVPILLKPPNEIDFEEKSLEFWRKWNFPNCVAGIDGKHIRIFCPQKSGSLFFNYKDYFSIVLLAMVDANCKFLFVDIGSYGKEGDSSIFTKSRMGELVYSGQLFPPNRELPGSNKKLPYVVVGDEAFRLHRHLLKPYSKPVARSDHKKSIFNYRLSRARRVTENAFGLLCQVFRVYYTPIAVKPDTCDKIIMATCCLHNLLRDAYLEKHNQPYFEYDPKERLPENVRDLVRPGGYANAEGFEVRDQYKDYFSEEGAIEWQNDRVLRTLT